MMTPNEVETSPFTYIIRPTDFPKYSIRSTEDYSTAMAPNGDECTFVTVAEAERWCHKHYHSQVSGCPMVCPHL